MEVVQDEIDGNDIDRERFDFRFIAKLDDPLRNLEPSDLNSRKLRRLVRTLRRFGRSGFITGRCQFGQIDMPILLYLSLKQRE